MKSSIIAVIALLFAGVLGSVYWFGSAEKAVNTPQLGELSMIKPSAPSQQVKQNDTQTSDSTATTTAFVVSPIKTPEEREQTLAQRKAALPIFMKVTGESIAKLQKEINNAKSLNKPAEEIAAKEAKLHQMQEIRQQVMARNADIMSSSART